MSSEQDDFMKSGTDLMNEILSNFTDGTKVSLVIRTPEYKTVVLTNEDDLNQIIEYLLAITAPEGLLH